MNKGVLFTGVIICLCPKYMCLGVIAPRVGVRSLRHVKLVDAILEEMDFTLIRPMIRTSAF